MVMVIELIFIRRLLLGFHVCHEKKYFTCINVWYRYALYLFEYINILHVCINFCQVKSMILDQHYNWSAKITIGLENGYLLIYMFDDRI